MNTQACISKVLLLTCLLGFPFSAPAQTDATKPGQSASEASDKVRQAELLQAERRAFVIASLTSLAEEARTYPDLAVRARVLARVVSARVGRCGTGRCPGTGRQHERKSTADSDGIATYQR